VGWRVWNVVAVDGELRLASLVYHELWEPGRVLAARCRRTLAALPWGRLPLHEPPSQDCCCGIYAVMSPALAATYLASTVEPGQRPVQRVVGSVSLWGRVVEAERGWRAAFAYPSRLVVPAGRLHRLAAVALWPYRPSPRDVALALEAYGVPVELAEPGELRGLARAPASRTSFSAA
jgi:hypothetical protein